jgi:3-dehydroquinate synthase
VGLSGSGKSTIGRLLAERLGVPFVDTDAFVEAQAGRRIAEIFAEQGEPAFRALERAAIETACALPSGVVATGGGAPIDPRNRSAMQNVGKLIWLDAPTEVLVTRLRAQSNGEVRPLLQGDALTRLQRLRAERADAYGEADVTVDTRSRTPHEVVEVIMTMLAPALEADPLWVRTPSQTYPVYMGPGVVAHAGELLRSNGLETPLRVIADEEVDRLHGDAIRAGLGDLPQAWYRVPAGEEHKNLQQVERLYDALLADRIERRDIIVALGGGVIGDLAGYVAATVLRGVRFIQIPTTVLSQVDSSVGGKVGVDHPRGKNLIGAFHQPSLVLADVDLLRTLPPRDVAAGWAEVVKIAVIQDAELFGKMEQTTDALRAIDPHAATAAIRRAVELKARVVEQDERDLTGIRAILNYGHTLGHALEAATGFASLLHGEGVAIGMGGAAYIAEKMNLHPADAVQRQAVLLERLGLPRSADVGPVEVRQAMGLDKKRVAGRTMWILPTGLGSVRTSTDVPSELVEAAIDFVTGGDAP